MTHAIFALCEGVHDVAFLGRLLKTARFSKYRQILRNYPKPLGELLLNPLKSVEFDIRQMDNLPFDNMLPDVMVRDETVILLYALGGDSQRKKCLDLVDRILQLKSEDPDAFDASGDLEYSILFFLDANSIGRGKRIEKLFRDLFLGDQYKDFQGISSDSIILPINGVRIGCFIFSDDSGFGTLEDIMLPIMEKGNEDIFDTAESFLTLRSDDRSRRLELYLNDEGRLCEKRSHRKCNFNAKKAKVGIAGQLQHSGASNAVIIRYSDYLDLEKIQNSFECQKIIRFIESELMAVHINKNLN